MNTSLIQTRNIDNVVSYIIFDYCSLSFILTWPPSFALLTNEWLEDGNLYLRLWKMSHTIYAANGKVSHIYRRMC
jgi:hypothetical protein